MTQAEQRAKVVAEAKTWLGTPYHHRGKVKGVGVDCAQLVLCVYACAGLVQDFDTGAYPPDWHLHREEERYMGIIRTLAVEIPRSALLPGDVILYRFGRAFSHGALVIDLPQLVHASRRDGAVVMTDEDRDVELIGRHTVCFSFWGPRDGG